MIVPLGGANGFDFGFGEGLQHCPQTMRCYDEFTSMHTLHKGAACSAQRIACLPSQAGSMRQTRALASLLVVSPCGHPYGPGRPRGPTWQSKPSIRPGPAPLNGRAQGSSSRGATGCGGLPPAAPHRADGGLRVGGRGCGRRFPLRPAAQHRAVLGLQVARCVCECRQGSSRVRLRWRSPRCEAADQGESRFAAAPEVKLPRARSSFQQPTTVAASTPDSAPQADAAGLPMATVPHLLQPRRCVSRCIARPFLDPLEAATGRPIQRDAAEKRDVCLDAAPIGEPRD